MTLRVNYLEALSVTEHVPFASKTNVIWQGSPHQKSSKNVAFLASTDKQTDRQTDRDESCSGGPPSTRGPLQKVSRSRGEASFPPFTPIKIQAGFSIKMMDFTANLRDIVLYWVHDVVLSPIVYALEFCVSKNQIHCTVLYLQIPN